MGSVSHGPDIDSVMASGQSHSVPMAMVRRNVLRSGSGMRWRRSCRVLSMPCASPARMSMSISCQSWMRVSMAAAGSASGGKQRAPTAWPPPSNAVGQPAVANSAAMVPAAGDVPATSTRRRPRRSAADDGCAVRLRLLRPPAMCSAILFSR